MADFYEDDFLEDDENRDSRNTASDENKDSFELLDRLDNLVADAKSVPFSSNCMVNREEVQMLIGLIRDSLPAQLRQSKWLIEQSRELLDTAREQADEIIDEAQHEVQQMIDEHEITQQARAYAQETIDEANAQADQIRDGALAYTDNHLTNLEDQIADMLVTIRKHKRDLNS